MDTRIKKVTLSLKDIDLNEGQIEGLPANPRNWTKEELKSLALSLTETPELFEMRCPIVVPHDGRYVVLGGNLRIAAARENKEKEVTCFVFNSTSIEKMKEIVIKDNGAWGKWDYDALANEWSDLALSDWGIPVWEESPQETAAAAGEEKQASEDDFDEDKDAIAVRCKRGDVWVLGDHRLMCGDSISLDDVKKLMGGAKADLVFTDPPYGVSIVSKNEMLNTILEAGRCIQYIENDNLSAEDLRGLIAGVMTNARLSCEPDACYYVTAPQRGDLGLMIQEAMRDAGLPVRHILIWRKNTATFSLGRLDYDYQHEPIFYTWTEKHHNYRKGEYRTSVWDYDKPRKCDLHPTMKPVELVANCMKDGTLLGDKILDLFGGSGTTLIAAEQLGRKCFMMELDPHYCDVIIARWEKLTGKTAILEQ
jgi:DNA modification methylase